jgi:hypothetical protein
VIGSLLAVATSTPLKYTYRPVSSRVAATCVHSITGNATAVIAW